MILKTATKSKLSELYFFTAHMNYMEDTVLLFLKENTTLTENVMKELDYLNVLFENVYESLFEESKDFSKIKFSNFENLLEFVLKDEYFASEMLPEEPIDYLYNQPKYSALALWERNFLLIPRESKLSAFGKKITKFSENLTGVTEEKKKGRSVVRKMMILMEISRCSFYLHKIFNINLELLKKIKDKSKEYIRILKDENDTRILEKNIKNIILKPRDYEKFVNILVERVKEYKTMQKKYKKISNYNHIEITHHKIQQILTAAKKFDQFKKIIKDLSYENFFIEQIRISQEDFLNTFEQFLNNPEKFHNILDISTQKSEQIPSNNLSPQSSFLAPQTVLSSMITDSVFRNDDLYKSNSFEKFNRLEDTNSFLVVENLDPLEKTTKNSIILQKTIKNNSKFCLHSAYKNS